MKKIVIITNMMSFYRLDLFNELSKNTDYRFHILFSNEVEDNSRKWEIDKNSLRFDYTILQSRSTVIRGKGIKETRIISYSKAVFKTLKKIQPDAIIASEYNPTSIKAFLYSRFHRIPFVSWSDGTLNSERFISLPQRLLRNLICRHAERLIASSSETRKAQIHYGAHPDRIAISYLTIDVDSFIENIQHLQKKKDPHPNILFVGYLLKLKGLDLLLDALMEIPNEFILDIVGSGEEEASLRQKVIGTPLENKVVFHGYHPRNEIHQFYKNAELFVFPSLNDAFGLVLVEAAAAGLPIISSIYAGGTADLIEDEVNGFIIDPKNTRQFREKIEFMLNHPTARQDMGDISREIATQFKLSEVVKGFFKTLEEIRWRKR